LIDTRLENEQLFVLQQTGKEITARQTRSGEAVLGLAGKESTALFVDSSVFHPPSPPHATYTRYRSDFPLTPIDLSNNL
jgi:hypothetical protein